MKTPKFDALLDKILDTLKPHQRECKECESVFTLDEGDITLLKMLRVPPPTLCPPCRNRRRLAYANYSNIYKRKCDFPGHSEMMISPVAPVMPWKTYDYDSYYGDSWSAGDYGLEIDTAKSFNEQYLKLLREVPHPGVRRGSDSPNSDYSFYGKFMKDSYYSFGGRRSEDVMYSSSVYNSMHIVDSYYPMDVDTAYESISMADSYKCFYAYFSSNCIDCRFVYDCHNCQDCFGCVNLRNKKYCFENVQLTKEEYEKRLSEINLGSIQEMKEIKNKFFEFVKQNPVRAVRVQNSQNCSGNDVKNSKNCKDVFQTENSENVRYANFAIMHKKDSMDINHSGRGEGMYEGQNSSTSSHVKFSFAIKESTDGEYLMGCVNCQNCFGCVNLKNGSYSIFNKQYEPEEYFQKLDLLKCRMLADGTYGEFFPMSFSPIAYNSSFAHIMYPMTEEEAKERGLYWQPEIDTELTGVKTLSFKDLPDDIKKVGEDISEVAIIGEDGKPFRLTKREIEFYKRYTLPLPTVAPYARMLARFKILNNFKTVEENCDLCGKITKSAYRASEGFIPYCDTCYKNTFL